MIDRQANINAKDSDEDTPLHRAASKRQKDAAIMLSNNGAEVNIVDTSCQTALHNAAADGRCDVIRA